MRLSRIEISFRDEPRAVANTTFLPEQLTYQAEASLAAAHQVANKLTQPPMQLKPQLLVVDVSVVPMVNLAVVVEEATDIKSCTLTCWIRFFIVIIQGASNYSIRNTELPESWI